MTQLIRAIPCNGDELHTPGGQILQMPEVAREGGSALHGENAGAASRIQRIPQSCRVLHDPQAAGIPPSLFPGKIQHRAAAVEGRLAPQGIRHPHRKQLRPRLQFSAPHQIDMPVVLEQVFSLVITFRQGITVQIEQPHAFPSLKMRHRARRFQTPPSDGRAAPPAWVPPPR